MVNFGNHSNQQKLFLSLPAIFFLFLLFMAGCDSNGGNGGDDGGNNTKTQYKVKYEVTGACDGIIALGYTIDGGGADGATPTLPWSYEFDFHVTGPFPAVALSVVCGGGSTNNSIAAKISVDGVQRDAKSGTGQNFTLTLSTVLSQTSG